MQVQIHCFALTFGNTACNLLSVTTFSIIMKGAVQLFLASERFPFKAKSAVLRETAKVVMLCYKIVTENHQLFVLW